MITNTGSLPYTKIKARILVDGIDILIRFCILRAVGSRFKCEFYGGNSDVFADLAGLRLRDLDLREWNHFWTFENVLSSRTNTEGYIYPLIDFLYPRTGLSEIDFAIIRTDLMCPFIFVDTVLAKIFEPLNYTIINEIQSEQWYIDSPLLVQGISTTKDKLKDRYTARFGLASNVFWFDGSYLISEEVVSSDFNYFTDATVNTNYGTGYSVPDNSVTLNISGKMFFVNETAPATITMQIFRNGDEAVAGQTLTITVPVSSGGGIPDAEVDFQFDEFTTVNEINNYFKILIYGGNVTSDAYQTAGSYMDMQCVSINEYSNELNYNTQIDTPFTYSYITASQMLPDMSQAEFIKQYCQMFGLLIVVNDVLDTITFVRMNKVVSNIGRAIDWSSKIDLSQMSEITFISGEYAKSNLFVYAEQSGETKPVGTDGEITIDNDNIEAQKTIVELSYSATLSSVVSSGSDYILRNTIDVHEKEVDADDIISYQRFQTIPNPRILFLQMLDSSDLGTSLTYEDGGVATPVVVSDDMPFTWFIQGAVNQYPAKEYNLGFGNNLLSNNYGAITDIIRSSKILTLPLRLTESDINQLDFTVPVFLSQYESYFYINKIEGYSPNSNTSCSVELVKLNL